MSLDRARRLGHRIESLATASLVARETMPQHEPERSPGEILLAELDAVITGEGLSRNAGERVLAAVDSAPETFASASVHQLRAYVGAAVGAGDPAGVGRLIEAAPEASREALSVRARDAFWFQLDLDTWAREGIFSEYPRSVLRSLRRQPYWRRGTVLADSGLDDRLRLAQAIQLRLKQPSPQAPPELGTVFVQLRDAARPAEMSRFDALRTVQSKHPGPSRLPGYQRGLITWARLEIDPTLDPEDPRSYERARRLGWYHDRPQVLRFLAQGARLNAEETTRVIEQINALSESQRLRFVGWFLGSQPEADKLAWIRSQARADGEASTLGQRVDDADETESFLAVFKVSAPAELGKIDDLPSLLLVLDQWDLTAHGYIDAMRALRYQQLLRERRLAEQNQPNTQHGFQESLMLWRNGGPDHVVQFIAQVRRARDRARSAWSTLVGLQRLDNADSAEPTAITSAVESARVVLGESRSLLAKLAADADGFVDGIFERGKEAEALRSQATETAAEASWLVGGLRGAFSAVGGFVDKLGEQLGDPKAWKTALEVGLEVAGATFSGGASVLIKLVKWLATTGVALKDTITGAVAKVRALAEPGGLAKMVPIGGLFSKSALISNVVGALFGEVPPEPQIDGESSPRDGKSEKTDEIREKGPAARWIAKVEEVVETVKTTAQGLVGATWTALRSIDITRFPAFQKFARVYYRLTQFREKVAGAKAAAAAFTTKMRDAIGGFFTTAVSKIRDALAVFADPAAAVKTWIQELVSSGIDHLVGLLITQPPSAILRTTFKAAASLLGTDTGDIAAKLRQTLASVPLIGDMIAKIESVVTDNLAPVAEGPAEAIYSTGSDLFEQQAMPAVEGLQGQLTTTLADAERFVGQLIGGLWDTVAEAPPKDVSTTETDGVAQTKRFAGAPAPAAARRSKPSSPKRSGEHLADALAASFLGTSVQRREEGPAPMLPVRVRQTASRDRIARSGDKDGEQSKGFFDSLKAKLHRSAEAIAKQRHARVRQMLEDYFDVNDASAIGTKVTERALKRLARKIVPKVWKHAIIQDLHAARSLVKIEGPSSNERYTVDEENVAEFARRLSDIRARFQQDTGIPVKAIKMEALKKRLKDGKTRWELEDPETGETIPTRSLTDINQSIFGRDGRNYASFRWVKGHLVYISDLKDDEQLGELWQELAHEVATYYTLYECQGKIPTHGFLHLHRVVQAAITSSEGLNRVTKYYR